MVSMIRFHLVYNYFLLLTAINKGEDGKFNDKNIQCNSETNTFKMVQFTDTHFGESYISDYLTLSTMDNILEIEQPDLVVLSGDIISGITWNGYGGWFQNKWDQMVQIMIKRNIKWIYTPGNHDSDGEWNASQIIRNDANQYSHLGSKTKIGFIDKHDQNAYYVAIYHAKTNVSIANIWMFDSGSLDCARNYSCYGCIHLSQMEWYKKQDHNVPGFIFVHIPIPQIMNYHLTQTFKYIGHYDEELSCFSEIELGNKSFMDYILEHDDIVGVIHGHEHEHDSIMLYKKNVMIAFGRKTGRSWIMGMETKWKLNSGARVIEFNCSEPKKWKTWIRDQYNNIEYETSYGEMIQNNRYNESKYNIDNICDANQLQNKCEDGYQWQALESSAKWFYQHWFLRNIVDCLDILCRWRIVQFISDNIFDLGISDPKFINRD